MTCKGSTGLGATLALSVDTTIAKIRNIQLPEFVGDAIDFTGLDASNFMCFLPSKLSDPGVCSWEMFYDSDLVLPTLQLVQTCTIQFPIQTAGNTTKANLVFSGFITSLGWANANVNEPIMQTCTFKLDGNSQVPAYSIEAA